ncbi:MAG: hypothetical protein L0Y72_28080 [Gemmataceae bacterium]|nr:hypothetical protein [Gemmataceae bacterium]
MYVPVIPKSDNPQLPRRNENPVLGYVWGLAAFALPCVFLTLFLTGVGGDSFQRILSRLFRL